MGYYLDICDVERELMLTKRSLNTAAVAAASTCLGMTLFACPAANAATQATTDTVDVSKSVINTNSKKTEKTNLSKYSEHVTYIVPLDEWLTKAGKAHKYASVKLDVASDSYAPNGSSLVWGDFPDNKAYIEVWGPGNHEIVLRETFLSKKGEVRHTIDYTFTARLRFTSISTQNVVLAPHSKKNASIAATQLALDYAKGDITWTSTKPEVATVDETGTVTAHKKGVCKIKATAVSSLTKKTVTVSCSVDVVSAKAYKAVAYAMEDYAKGTIQYSQSKRMKKNYRDCSSFVGRAYSRLNVKLGDESWTLEWSPTAADEAKYLKSKGKTVATGPVSAKKLRAGDLIFYSNTKDLDSIYHVAMYVGGGRVMHASDYDTGSAVRYRYSVLAKESKKSLESDSKIVFIGRPCA